MGTLFSSLISLARCRSVSWLLGLPRISVSWFHLRLGICWTLSIYTTLAMLANRSFFPDLVFPQTAHHTCIRFDPIESAGWSPVSYMVGLLMSGYVCVIIRWRPCIEVCERPKSHMKEELRVSEIGTDHEHMALVLAKGCAPVKPGL